MARQFEPELKDHDLRSPQRRAAEAFLGSLFMQPPPSLPLEQVAGMSPAEEMAQRLVMQYGGSEMEGLDTLRAYTKEGNILDRPEIQAILNEVMREGGEMANRLGRGLQLRGGATSSGAADTLGRSTTQTQQALLATLAPYLQGAETRRLGAAQSLAGLSESGMLNRLNALSTTGSLPRQLEQLRNIAQYERDMQQTLFPYTYQAQAATTLSQSGEPYMVYKRPSMYQQIAPAVGAIIGGIFGGGAGAQMGQQMGQESGQALESGYSYNVNSSGGGGGGNQAQQNQGQSGGGYSNIAGLFSQMFGGGSGSTADWQKGAESYYGRSYGGGGY